MPLEPKLLEALKKRRMPSNEGGIDTTFMMDHDQIMPYQQKLDSYSFEPKLAGYYNNRGNTFYNQGKLDKAIADLDKAIALAPKFVVAYYNRGNALSRKGAFDKAIADFTQAIALDSKTHVGYVLRGLAYEKKGDRAKAIADYRQAIALRLLPEDQARIEKRLRPLLTK